MRDDNLYVLSGDMDRSIVRLFGKFLVYKVKKTVF